MTRPPLVIASNLSGGIARHLEITRGVLDLRVVDLPESMSLAAKARRVRQVLAEQDERLVVTHGVAAGLAVRLRGPRLRRVRHLEFWHGDPFFGSPKRRAAFHAAALPGRAPDEQVFTHDWLRVAYAARGSVTHVLPNAVPPQQPSQPQAQPSAPTGDEVTADGARHAAYLGRLSPEKGFTDLLAAWPEDSAARGWVLDVFGDGPLGTEALPPGVVLHGPTDRPLARLAGAELVVVPSWTETGPYVALEAAVVGRPLVGTAVGDMPDLIGAAGCGWLVQPRDVPGLRHALREAQQESPEELRARGTRGTRWLAEHRPFAAWAVQVRTLYAADPPAVDVCVVVPTLGQRPDYLRLTLDSLQGQRGVGVRVVVVAPASAQAVREECARRGIDFVAQTGRGMSQAINQGWVTRGEGAEFWAWLGDDDLLPQGSLEAAVAALRRSPRAAMAYGRCAYIDAEGGTLFEARPGRFASWLLRWGPDLVAQPGSLARASVVRESGLLDERLRFAMDLELFLRLKDAGGLVYVPRTLAAFRWHEGSTTVGDPGASDAEAREVRRRTWVGRRRVGYASERLAHQAGRVLHRLQRRAPSRRPASSSSPTAQ